MLSTKYLRLIAVAFVLAVLWRCNQALSMGGPFALVAVAAVLVVVGELLRLLFDDL